MSETITEIVAPVATTTDTTTTTAKTDAPAPKTDAPKPEDGDSLLGKKTEEGKPEAVAKVVPEKYEFKLPEGMEMDAAFLEQATPIMKELKLDQAEAGKLVDLMVKKTQADADRWTKTVDGWKEATIKELGDDAPAKLALTAKFIDKFGNKRADAIRKILNDTGLGSNPDIVYLFAEAGKFFSSDTLVTGGNQNTTTTDPEKLAQKIFNNTKY